MSVKPRKEKSKWKRTKYKMTVVAWRRVNSKLTFKLTCDPISLLYFITRIDFWLTPTCRWRNIGGLNNYVQVWIIYFLVHSRMVVIDFSLLRRFIFFVISQVILESFISRTRCLRNHSSAIVQYCHNTLTTCLRPCDALRFAESPWNGDKVRLIEGTKSWRRIVHQLLPSRQRFWLQ